MGCSCSKGIKADEHIGSQRVKSKSLKRLVTSSKKEEGLVAGAEEISGNEGGRERLISKPEENVVTPTPMLPNKGEKKVAMVVDSTRNGVGHQRQATVDAGADRAEPNSKIVGTTNEAKPNLAISNVLNAFEGEHVAAGWPSWLTSVAGEAVKGWLPLRADSFEKLN